MNDDQTRAASDDEAFARLRAADPAAGVEPDLGRVRSALSGVTASTAATSSPGTSGTWGSPGSPGTPGASGASGSPGTPGSTDRQAAGDEDVVVEEITVDELAAARSRRRPARWLQVAAAVAGVAIVGSAGYVAGTNRADTTQTADSASDAEPAIGLAEPGLAPEAARDAGGMSSMATDKASAWYGGRTVFSSSGLSDEGGSGKAWALDAASVYSAATVAHLAEVLHVSGDPVQQYGTWMVGPQDGSAPSVSLSPDGAASVSYYDPTRDPWSCVKSAPDEVQSDPAAGAGTDSSSGDSAVSPVAPPEDLPSTCDPSTAAAPGADDAKAQASDLLSAFGIDPAGYELEVVDSGTSQAASVNAYQVVDGARSGVTWSFTILGDGVQSLWGSLAPLVELGTYDVVSPAAAVERLGDPRFGASSGGMMPLAVDARAAAEGGATTDMMPAPEATPTVPATPEAGSPLGWPVQEVVITSARLGVALTTLPSGASVLVPTYELSSEDGSTWSVIAVVDDQLDFSPVG